MALRLPSITATNAMLGGRAVETTLLPVLGTSGSSNAGMVGWQKLYAALADPVLVAAQR